MFTWNFSLLDRLKLPIPFMAWSQGYFPRGTETADLFVDCSKSLWVVGGQWPSDYTILGNRSYVNYHIPYITQFYPSQLTKIFRQCKRSLGNETVTLCKNWLHDRVKNIAIWSFDSNRQPKRITKNQHYRHCVILDTEI